ncbi:hypothetical protein ACFWYW_56740 [Nonomuraea sp. NPDC059023]|uniref:hypothetical protein n=1 Tax=unclassified Nonomuraea TaxID=2593643 RepID=UPI0036CEB7DA
MHTLDIGPLTVPVIVLVVLAVVFTWVFYLAARSLLSYRAQLNALPCARRLDDQPGDGAKADSTPAATA